jgi:hypothetical protein
LHRQKDEVVRLLQPRFDQIEVSSKDTVGKLFLGACADSIFFKEVSQVSFFILWIAGFIISLLVVYEVAPSDWMYLTVLTWPTVFLNVCLMNRKMIPRLLSDFLTLYGTFYLIMYILCISMIFKEGGWTMFAVSTFLSLFHVYFYDALPEKLRLPVIKIGSLCAVIFLSALIYGLKQRQDLIRKDIVFGDETSGLSIRASSLCVGAISNMMALFMKHFSAVILKPHALVIFKSDIESVKVNVDDARMVRAMQGKEMKIERVKKSGSTNSGGRQQAVLSI